MAKRIIPAMLLAALLAPLSGCVGVFSVEVNMDLTDTYKLDGVPFIKQEKDRCAEAAARGLLGYWGITPDGADELFNPEVKGTEVIALVKYLSAYGHADALRLDYEGIKAEIRGGRPVIILIEDTGTPSGHYVLVKGYKKKSRRLVANDGKEQNAVIKADGEFVSITFSPDK